MLLVVRVIVSGGACIQNSTKTALSLQTSELEAKNIFFNQSHRPRPGSRLEPAMLAAVLVVAVFKQDVVHILLVVATRSLQLLPTSSRSKNMN